MDGDEMWDIYALVALIVESDMGTDAYKKVQDERAGKTLIQRHIQEKGTCKELVELAEMVILNPKGYE
jgi:hypothetical protein